MADAVEGNLKNLKIGSTIHKELKQRSVETGESLQTITERALMRELRGTVPKDNPLADLPLAKANLLLRLAKVLKSTLPETLVRGIEALIETAELYSTKE